MEKLSIEFFFHYLRFEAFKNFTKDEQLDLLLAAVKVPLKKGDNMNRMLSFIETSDYEGALNFLQMNAIKDLPETPMNFENIFNIYMKEDDSELSFKLLRFLLFTPMTSETLEGFAESYFAMSQGDRDIMVPNVLYQSFHI
jgi:hypothetical protein